MRHKYFKLYFVLKAGVSFDARRAYPLVIRVS